MIYKGDIIRLLNPSEPGLAYLPHMHVVESIYNESDNIKRRFAVCTTNPLKYIKQGVPFLQVNEQPFREETYIRLDPMYAIQNVKIKAESRIQPNYKLQTYTESKFFERVTGAKEEVLVRDRFIGSNRRYALPVEMEISW